MTRWMTLLSALALLFPAALAGCIATTAAPDPGPEPMGAPDAPGSTLAAGEAPEHVNASDVAWASPNPCVMTDDPRDPYGCFPYEGQPVLGAFEFREVATCDACASVVVATYNGSLLFATEEGLLVVDGSSSTLLAPPPASKDLPAQPRASPSLFVSASGRVWYAVLEGEGALRSLFVGAWTDGAAWDATTRVDAASAPMLPLVERAWAVHARGALVVVLASENAAWALRSLDGGKSFRAPDLLSPSLGRTVVGAPWVDAKERVLVPFLATQTMVGSSLFSAGSTQWILQTAVLGDARAEWSLVGSAYAPLGVAPDSRPALAAGAGMSTFAWVDAGGTLTRSDISDDGSSWGQHSAWTSEHARAVGSATLARHAPPARSDETGHYPSYGGPQTTGAVTAAWWEESGALVVGRSLWGESPTRASMVSLDAPMASAALALKENGRALVAWLDQGALWIGEEQPPQARHGFYAIE